MKKQFKIIILIAMCLAVVGIYLGKNTYFKKETPKHQVQIESQKEQATNMPTLLEFSSETWPACVQMVSVMKEVEKEYKGKAIIKTLLVNESKENYNLAGKYNIMVVPTLVFLKEDGSEYKRIEGFTPKKDIDKIFSEMGVK